MATKGVRSNWSLYELIIMKVKLPEQCSRCFDYCRWYELTTRPRIICGSCGWQVSPMSCTTLFYQSRMTANEWLTAYRMVRENPDVSAWAISRAIGLKNHMSAQRMKQLILENPEESDYYLGESDEQPVT